MDFETVYLELFTPLYRYVFFRVRNYDESMDIIQSVFTKVFEKYPEKKSGELYPIIYRSARNEIIDRGTKKKTMSLDPMDSEFTNYHDEVIRNPEQAAERKDLLNLIAKLLEQLPEDDQELITLRYLQEKEYSEIAVILGKKEATVRQSLSRGMKKLRTYYEQSP
jgi:RNA polymerase sigma-70 factor (ECF subfamily)